MKRSVSVSSKIKGNVFDRLPQELIRYYLDHKLVDINRKTNAGYSPLHEAACHSQVKAAEVLIAYGADVNVQSDEGQK